MPDSKNAVAVSDHIDPVGASALAPSGPAHGVGPAGGSACTAPSAAPCAGLQVLGAAPGAPGIGLHVLTGTASPSTGCSRSAVSLLGAGHGFAVPLPSLLGLHPSARWVTVLRRVGVLVHVERWDAALAWCLANLDSKRIEGLSLYGPAVRQLALAAPDGRVRVGKWRRRPAGRWYAEDPEIQSVTRYMRCGVVPTAGFVFADVDFKACHLYIAAFIARDEVLLADLRSSDLHQITGSQIAPDTDRDTARTLGKVLNFTVLNGGGRTAIVKAAAAEGIPLARAEAGQLRDRWLRRYATIARWAAELAANEVWVNDGQDRHGGPTRRWIQRDRRLDLTYAKLLRQRTSLELQARESAILAHMLRAVVEAAIVTPGWNPEDPLSWPIRPCLAMHDGLLLEVQHGYEGQIEAWLHNQAEKACAAVGLPPIPLEIDFRGSWASRKHDPWAAPREATSSAADAAGTSAARTSQQQPGGPAGLAPKGPE